ncbi:hypothetical protein MMC25_003761 [Agyrium rufum]|nr:hypothetical protein [Agyrium rufum]
MAEFREVPSHRGRLYCAVNNRFILSPSPTGYFQPRIPRPHILRIAHAQAHHFEAEKNKEGNRERLIKYTKFTQRKENAKRLLRQVYQHNWSRDLFEPTKEQQPIRSNRWSGISVASSGISHFSSLAEIMAADGGRTGRPRTLSAVNSAPATRPSVSNSRNASPSPMRPDNTQALIGDEKPVATGNGVSVSISLAEPVLFLQGFDHSDLTNRNTTLLRGSLRLRVSKSAKIKSVSLAFRGKAITEWPEGIPPKKIEFQDVESIMNHTWPFFNAQFQTAEYGHGADSVQPLKGPTTSTRELQVPGVTSFAFDHFQRNSRPTDGRLTAKDVKKLSLAVNQSRSFGKGDTTNGGSVAQKGYRTFTPGDYIYGFELPIDSRMPETIDVELGKVKYELEATIERAGAFKTNLIGSREVTMIRAPSENSLETVEPIAISRNWEDQLHYDIVISGKSFPLGAQVPIAFKLTPLAKVQCHSIKVFVTENIHYYTANKRVHRLEPTRKVKLFEKRADAQSSSTYPGSSVRILAGGGVPYDERDAAARGEENIPRDTTNLLGDLETGHNIGPTELEFSVQLPSCWAMQEKDKISRIHFDTTFANIQVHHWIKIVLRLSKPDTEDPTKRRHFEISIDSPFNILSCRATQAATALPAYTSPDAHASPQTSPECGCPGAPHRNITPPQGVPTLGSLQTTSQNSSSTIDGSNTTLGAATSGARHNRSHSDLPLRNVDTFGLARPPTAHISDYDHIGGVSRPMHLVRAPSFNPPAFGDEEPPPPLMTPPPLYDSIVTGDPRGGLADYFARLAEEEGSDVEDGDPRVLRSPRDPSRMQVPLTPGGRVNRSMDERRTWLPAGT